MNPVLADAILTGSRLHIAVDAVGRAAVYFAALAGMAFVFTACAGVSRRAQRHVQHVKTLRNWVSVLAAACWLLGSALVGLSIRNERALSRDVKSLACSATGEDDSCVRGAETRLRVGAGRE